MNIMTQLQIAFEMWKDWLKTVFGGGVMFPTAPGYVESYSK